MVHRSEQEFRCSKEEVCGSHAENEIKDIIMYPLSVLLIFKNQWMRRFLREILC